VADVFFWMEIHMNIIKQMKCLIVAAVVILLLSGPALAHKVNLFAYAEGGKIYTESYFPDGKPVEGGKVLVYDSQDQLVLEGVTDNDGLFSFDIPKIDDFNIVINASMGHRNSFKLKKSEVEAGK
jgi:nickel transport protein